MKRQRIKYKNKYLHIKVLHNPNDMTGDKSRDTHPCFHNANRCNIKEVANFLSHFFPQYFSLNMKHSAIPFNPSRTRTGYYRYRTLFSLQCLIAFESFWDQQLKSLAINEPQMLS